MRCLQSFCIYQSNNECKFGDIHIDTAGSCPFFIPVIIPENVLDEYKKKHLRNVESKMKVLEFKFSDL